MKKSIIHLSDLHFRLNWDEDQGIVLKGFFKDLEKQIQRIDHTSVYIAFTGDVVLAGADKKLYDEFYNQFDSELNRLNIPKNRRICVPGNHDISLEYIKNNIVEHEGVVSQNLIEREFNDYISQQTQLITNKFDNYFDFEQKFAAYGAKGRTISGTGWNIDDNIGVYCLNSALLASAGVDEINDKSRLAIDTRQLSRWAIENDSKTKILLMHHPIEWLTKWAQEEINKLLMQYFKLLLTGHNHDQAFFYSIKNDSELVNCSAPPLLTSKKGDLGYSIITVSESGVLCIQYRQWTKNNKFVTGVNFSDTDDGIIRVKDEHQRCNGAIDKIGTILIKKFDNALRSFSSQPIIWVEPTLSKTNELTVNPDEKSDDKVDLNQFILNPKSTIIKAPPQYGLTCLAHYMVKEAWLQNNSFWLYLDCLTFKSHNIEKAIKKELEVFDYKKESIKSIVLDSWTNLETDNFKILKSLSESFKNIPIIVMQTIDETKFFSGAKNENIDREFNVFHLLALPRAKIRKVVSAYNEETHIADEDAVMLKLVTDLDVLNIPRTPLNCITLLKVSEKYFDESPVNRTKMLEMVLFLLFNLDDIPTYKTKPDLKDCEYVLGRFCEKMIRKGQNFFSREDFIKDLKEFCTEKLIDLEVDFVFDILFANNIIIKREIQFGFRFTYWVYYFAAQRMHHDPDFANYILGNKTYVSFPEIIEFYTGIDRMREDAIKTLTEDIKSVCDRVQAKVGLPEDMNPYRLMNWNPSPESIEKMHDEISDNVLNSNLPAAVKDQFADRYYNQLKPYNQTIQFVFQEYSVLVLMQSIKAASRALRNSDYIDPKLKRELLNEIIRSWSQVSKVILALTPLLAMRGDVKFDGVTFFLYGDFGESVEKRIHAILTVIPFNVVNWFKDDLFSQKMGPLLFDFIQSEKNELKKHELALLLVNERPKDWKEQVQKYIVSLSKNSFYLYDIFTSLRGQYRYSFASPRDLNEISYLIKMGLAKHEFGINHPKLDKIMKISNKVLPKRGIDNNEKDN